MAIGLLLLTNLLNYSCFFLLIIKAELILRALRASLRDLNAIRADDSNFDENFQSFAEKMVSSIGDQIRGERARVQSDIRRFTV